MCETIMVIISYRGMTAIPVIKIERKGGE